jgi:hypothetical protein
MSSLEQLVALEIEFHLKLRHEALGTTDALHRGYALQAGSEPLLRGVGRAPNRGVKRVPFSDVADRRRLLDTGRNAPGVGCTGIAKSYQGPEHRSRSKEV